MRPKGHASVNQNRTVAFAVCDRCGSLYNHNKLSWQFQWYGTQLQNIRILVCDSCMDIPQEQLRVTILPPDPVPIMNARPENYVLADNPLSPLGASPNFSRQTDGSRIGNLMGGGGLNAAFDGNSYKPAWQSANNMISNSSFDNYVGINWTGMNTSILSMPSSLMPPVLTHSIESFTLTAPNDRSFLGLTPTDYVVQGSAADSSLYSAWDTISSGTTAGTAGESITATSTFGGRYQFHRVAFLGDGLNPASVAQVEFNVAQTGTVTVST